MLKCSVCNFVSMNEDEFNGQMKSLHNNPTKTGFTDETNQSNKAKENAELCDQSQKCNEEKAGLKKQVKELQLMSEVASEVFNEELDKKKKELEKIKKDKLKSDKDHVLELKEMKEQLSRSFAEVKK